MTRQSNQWFSRVVSVLLVAASVATLGLIWWLSDAVLVRSGADGISRDAAEMLGVVGTAIRVYLLPAVGLITLLAVVSAVSSFRRPFDAGASLN